MTTRTVETEETICNRCDRRLTKRDQPNSTAEVDAREMAREIWKVLWRLDGEASRDPDLCRRCVPAILALGRRVLQQPRRGA